MRKLTAITTMLCVFSLIYVALCYSTSIPEKARSDISIVMSVPAEVPQTIVISDIKEAVPRIEVVGNITEGVVPEVIERCNSPG